jgi:medium-chain acyl-[acyl-carrier-protein] hydrolase
MEVLLPMLRADFALGESYVYESETALKCGLTAIAGSSDRYVCRDDMEAWREQTAGGFSMVVLEGDHFFFHSAGQTLIERVYRTLATHLQATV